MMGMGEAAAVVVGGLFQILMVVGLFRLARGEGGAALVIRKWSTTTAPADPEATYVEIVGRGEGLVAWVLTLLGVDVTTTLRVNARNVVFHEATIFGHRRTAIPIRHVGRVVSGYRRPVLKALMVFFIFASLGAAIGNAADSGAVAALLFLIGVILAVVAYALGKTFLFEVTSETRSARIEFKRSVIENEAIDERQAEQVVAVLTTLIDAER